MNYDEHTTTILDKHLGAGFSPSHKKSLKVMQDFRDVLDFNIEMVIDALNYNHQAESILELSTPFLANLDRLIKEHTYILSMTQKEDINLVLLNFYNSLIEQSDKLNAARYKCLNKGRISFHTDNFIFNTFVYFVQSWAKAQRRKDYKDSVGFNRHIMMTFPDLPISYFIENMKLEELAA